MFRKVMPSASCEWCGAVATTIDEDGDDACAKCGIPCPPGARVFPFLAREQCAKFGVTYRCFYERVAKGWSFGQALKTPVRAARGGRPVADLTYVPTPLENACEP